MTNVKTDKRLEQSTSSDEQQNQSELIIIDPTLVEQPTTTTTNNNNNNNNSLSKLTVSSLKSLNLSSQLVEKSLTPIRVGDNWACRICRRQFTRRFNCTTHERTHLDLQQRSQFLCALCERSFTRRHDLERHINSVHPGHILEREPVSGFNSNQIEINNGNTSQDQGIVVRNSFSQPNHQQLKIRRIDDGMLVAGPSSGRLGSNQTTDQVRILVIEQPINNDSSNPINPSEKDLEHNGPTAILTSGSIRDLSQAVERVPLEHLATSNPNREPIFRVDSKWACGTCGRIFVRRNNCKAHEATHRDVREHQCPTCLRSFSRRHDLERHIHAVHPGNDVPIKAEYIQNKRRKTSEGVAEGEVETWEMIDPVLKSLLTLDSKDTKNFVSPKMQALPVDNKPGNVFDPFESLPSQDQQLYVRTLPRISSPRQSSRPNPSRSSCSSSLVSEDHKIGSSRFEDFEECSDSMRNGSYTNDNGAFEDGLEPENGEVQKSGAVHLGGIDPRLVSL
ncbi:hypothetical protein BY996DRAFT_7137652 [Phakopsora pachyrhizi]|nr:hypothetical protein BY996DRAFT_7137652 [Phakopsora pachyrhizi]